MDTALNNLADKASALVAQATGTTPAAGKTAAKSRAVRGIRVDADHATKIQAALDAANGGATAHTYTDADDILAMAAWAEGRLEKLGIAKSRRAGASVMACSGERVPNAYARLGRERAATAVHLVRRSEDWYLVSARRAVVWQDGGYRHLHLTRDQDAEAVAVFRSNYRTGPTA